MLLLLVFQKFLELNVQFTLKMDSDVHHSSVSPSQSLLLLICIQYTSISLFLSPFISLCLTSATHLSIQLCITYLAFKVF